MVHRPEKNEGATLIKIKYNESEFEKNGSKLFAGLFLFGLCAIKLFILIQ
jgi:hypothetical protein